MAYEIQHRIVRGNSYGSDWMRYPCVAVTRQGVTFNNLFLEAFLSDRRSVIVLIDKERRFIAFKTPGAQDVNDSTVFNVRSHSKSKNSKKGNGSGAALAHKVIPTTFPDLVGMAFRAHLNAGERIIEVDLSPTNRTK